MKGGAGEGDCKQATVEGKNGSQNRKLCVDILSQCERKLKSNVRHEES